MKRKFLVIMMSVLLCSSCVSPVFAQEAEWQSQIEEVVCGNIDVVSLSEEDFSEETIVKTVEENELYEYLETNHGPLSSSGDDCTEYYGNQLDGVEAEIYQKLKSATPEISAENNGISITLDCNGQSFQDAFNSYSEKIFKVMAAYQYDHPQQFYFSDSNGISVGAKGNSSRIVFTAAYKKSNYYNATIQNQADAVIGTIVSQNTGKTRYDRVKFFHDWLVSNCEYDQVALSASKGSERAYYAHGAIGCLINKTGVCESYAKSFKILCNKLNIPCIIVSSSSHAWNYVLMPNGKWYMVDCTFDDPIGAPAGYIGYDYFLTSNNPAVDSDHVTDSTGTNLRYPETATEKYVVSENEPNEEEPGTDEPAADEPAADEPSKPSVKPTIHPGAQDVTPDLSVKNQTITVSRKYQKTVTQKSAVLKKKKVTYKLNASAKGVLTYKVTKGSKKYISVSKSGVVTLKKGCKKGTYKVMITAEATKDGLFKKATKTVKFVVK